MHKNKVLEMVQCLINYHLRMFYGYLFIALVASELIPREKVTKTSTSTTTTTTTTTTPGTVSVKTEPGIISIISLIYSN